MRKIRVVLADDHAILTQGTASVLLQYEHIETVGAVSNGDQALQMVKKLKPDVLLSDISMPGDSVFEIAEEVRRKGLPTRVIIFSMHNTPEYVFKALHSGVAGYITKFADKEEVVKAIRTVAAGKEYYSQAITQTILKGFKKHKHVETKEENPLRSLSKRELEILSMIVEGLTTRQIAKKLLLSERTIYNHRANMMQKCKVNNVVELVTLYLDEVNNW